MKASAFAYARATSVGNALELLAAHGDKAKVLSGGQSLMPAMNLRLISPELIIDIGAIDELRGIKAKGEALSIGALTRHVDLLKSREIAAHSPLLTKAVAHVAHPAIRNRGTIGGSLAHADPASELPACMLALGAAIVVRGQAGERKIPAKDFFRGIYETALKADELLVAVELPVMRENATHFFHEFARRHGDYAITGLAAQAIVKGDALTELDVAFFAVGDRPVLSAAVRKLVDVVITPALMVDVLAALDEELDPHDDQQASDEQPLDAARQVVPVSVEERLVARDAFVHSPTLAVRPLPVKALPRRT